MKKTIKLLRQNHLNPNMKELDETRRELEELINDRYDFENSWNDVIKQIIQFQYEDGSFNLLDSYRIDSDYRVEYCHEPTYICSALLIKALLEDKDVFTGKEDIILSKALYMCCARGLSGHGYDSIRGQIKAINYFINCDVKTFLIKYPHICPKFTEMFKQIKEQYAKYVKEQRFTGVWGEDYENEIRNIYKYFNDTPVLVYGTLMKGQSNHDYFLGNANFLGKAMLPNYEMYDLGSYPGIVEGFGKVQGEVYGVDDSILESIDYLESEGNLYIRKLVKVFLSNDEIMDAWCYIYNRSVEGYDKINGRYSQEEMIWYVAYGSNLLEERLKYYIEGGFCEYNNKHYQGCKDKTLFLETRPVMIPYNMYYSNFNKGAWENSAVSFLDLSKSGKAYGRAYKIKRSQLDDIHLQEGKGSFWYPNCIQLDDIDGLSAYAIANYQIKEKEPFSKVSAEYRYVLYKGMKEAYPELSDAEIFSYLKDCGK